MRQSSVVSVCFSSPPPQSATTQEAAIIPSSSSENHPRRWRLPQELRDVLPLMDAQQPYAVLRDGCTMPLQCLHCCYDPRMRSWQDVAISTLSLMPTKRMDLLRSFHAVLERGLRMWGLHLSPHALQTKALSVLPLPERIPHGISGYVRKAAVRHAPPPAYPTTLMVVGLTSPTTSEEVRHRIVTTVQNLTEYFRTNIVACVGTEAEAITFVSERLAQMLPPPSSSSSSPRGATPALIFITEPAQRTSRTTRWVMAECLSRGVLPIVCGPAPTQRRAGLLAGNLRRQINAKFECNPLRGVHLAKEVPVLVGKRVLMIGVDTCHTASMSVGSVVGILVSPERNHLLPVFWRQDARGQESAHVGQHVGIVMQRAARLYDGLDEVIVMQDGNVFSELNGMREELHQLVPQCGLTFLCLHKATNVRFIHDDGRTTTDGRGRGTLQRYNNISKGVLITNLTPVALNHDVAAPSFYLQTHEGLASTARIIQYSVHHISPTLDITDVQQMANVMANVMAPQATKLPMSTRCAHRLADVAERLMDAVPQFTADAIPAPLNERLWFL